jgi:DME family drug/metabolite transporter
MEVIQARAMGRWLGYLEAIAAACLWGSSGIFSVHLFRAGVPPESLALLRPMVGALVLVAVFGATTIALAQFLFFDALARIEAGRASLATAIEPVVAAMLATLLLDQGLRPLGWAGIALVVAGVVGVGVTGQSPSSITSE